MAIKPMCVGSKIRFDLVDETERKIDKLLSEGIITNTDCGGVASAWVINIDDFYRNKITYDNPNPPTSFISFYDLNEHERNLLAYRYDEAGWGQVYFATVADLSRGLLRTSKIDQQLLKPHLERILTSSTVTLDRETIVNLILVKEYVPWRSNPN
jgi:hypothetical protein